MPEDLGRCDRLSWRACGLLNTTDHASDSTEDVAVNVQVKNMPWIIDIRPGIAARENHDASNGMNRIYLG
jgi:hypothetical protein